MMIVAGQLLLEADGSRCRLAPGYLRLDGERIVDLVEGEIPESADLGGPRSLVSPGFIDAHLHLPQFGIIGAHGMPLLRWLSDVTFPAEMQWHDSGIASAMTRRAIGQLLKHGTTGIAAYATVHQDATREALRVAAEQGMRGVIGQVLMDCNAPEALCRDPGQLLDEAAQLADEFPPSGRMAAAVTPRFAITCSKELLRGAGELASATGAIVQTHLAETAAECRRVSELFDGRSYTQVYEEAGLLGPKSVFGHGIHLDDDSLGLLREHHAVIAHCPTANSFLRSGEMSRERLLAARIPVAVGSDIGAGFEISMVRVARAMIQTAALIGDSFPDAAAAWHAITYGNARHLGWHDGGSLQPGAIADLVVATPDANQIGSQVDRLSHLLFAWDDRWITHTLLRGEVAYAAA